VQQRRWGFLLRQQDITEMDDVTIWTRAVPSSPTKLTLNLETSNAKAAKDVHQKRNFRAKGFASYRS
jgi:squalene cyclase